MNLLAAILDPYITDWLDLLVRWLHVIAAIGWIGSSFYFVLLDQSLRTPKEQQDIDDGVKGELWEVHGGGFYHVKKYQVAPPELPDHLAWFKWEAYTTWISGFTLMVVLYWLNAKAYMIDPSVAKLGPWQAVGISAGLLLVGWLVYDGLCRVLKNHQRWFAVAISLCIALTAWGTAQLYAPRAAWLQVGAMLGTIMVANVFFNIIPAHWELIRAKEAGRDPDPEPGIEAKRRSVHNNYLTLPVLITMLAGHFGFMTGHDYAWMLLLFMMLLGAWIRHFYNLRHAGTTHWWMPAVAAAAVVTLFVALWPADNAVDSKASSSGTKAAATTAIVAGPGKDLFTTNCAGCHMLKAAGSHGDMGPSLDALQPSADVVAAQVANGGGGMPAFSGTLSQKEIDEIAAYVSKNAGG